MLYFSISDNQCLYNMPQGPYECWGMTQNSITNLIYVNINQCRNVQCYHGKERLDTIYAPANNKNNVSVWDMVFIITVTSQWARWRVKSPVLQMFTEPFIQAHIEENTKAPRHWPLWGKFTGENVSIWWRHHMNTIAHHHRQRHRRRHHYLHHHRHYCYVYHYQHCYYNLNCFPIHPCVY